jgi:hypothetical protein
MPKKIVKIEYKVRYIATLIVDDDVEVNNDLFMDVDIPENGSNEYVEQSSDIIEVRELDQDKVNELAEWWGMFITNQECDDAITLCERYVDEMGVELNTHEGGRFFELGEQWLVDNPEHDRRLQHED